ncbi:hypothetical protein PF008_g16745 [Phytophthora fragariae]|uniref:Uncharacterized protein n=1 Tax=Phytophthora fragariae TaxID=53985 RepID=A0A6G0RA95_9STRA|nr:hypothetical protein PF008_g16745 [Phytophthora fragariae]
MRVHNAVWAFAESFGNDWARDYARERKTMSEPDRKKKDTKWLVGHGGKRLRDLWFGVPVGKRQLLMEITPDSSFPVDTDGVCDERQKNRTVSLPIQRPAKPRFTKATTRSPTFKCNGSASTSKKAAKSRAKKVTASSQAATRSLTIKLNRSADTSTMVSKSRAKKVTGSSLTFKRTSSESMSKALSKLRGEKAPSKQRGGNVTTENSSTYRTNSASTTVDNGSAATVLQNKLVIMRSARSNYHRIASDEHMLKLQTAYDHGNMSGVVDAMVRSVEHAIQLARSQDRTSTVEETYRVVCTRVSDVLRPALSMTRFEPDFQSDPPPHRSLPRLGLRRR